MRTYILKEKSSVSRFLQLLALNFFYDLGRNRIDVETDNVVGLFFGWSLKKKNLERVVQHLLPTRTCELMCHPGLDDPKSRDSNCGYDRAGELSALIDREIFEFLQHRYLQVISYRHLGGL